uniref:Uncharacterized protein n=1 Tax=Anopheles albimanus TaxID=7167 RepID=A0A182FYA6_ANOAL
MKCARRIRSVAGSVATVSCTRSALVAWSCSTLASSPSAPLESQNNVEGLMCGRTIYEYYIKLRPDDTSINPWSLFKNV